MRHHPGDVGLTASATWASPPGRRTQECTQIGGNGLSVPFRGICVHCCAVGLGCGWPWDRNSVHKWEDRASPRRIGAFVYTVALWRRCGQARGSQECTQIDQNGLSVLFWGICVHCCDASRDTNRDASCLRQVARAPQPPRRAGGAPSLAPPAWSGGQTLSEWRRCQVSVFAEASTHTNPRRASDYGQ